MAWAPTYGEDRREDYTRAQKRARVLRKSETPHEKRKLLIELDGAVHELPEVREADQVKEIDAIVRGYKVIRVTNEELRADSGAVVERLRALIIARPSSQRKEGREGGRTTGHGARRSSATDCALSSMDTPYPDRPLPLPPPPGAGEESGS